MNMQKPQTFSVLDITCNDFQQLVCTEKVSLSVLYIYIYTNRFTPCIAIYQLCTVPSIWLMEYREFGRRTHDDTIPSAAISTLASKLTATTLAPDTHSAIRRSVDNVTSYNMTTLSTDASGQPETDAIVNLTTVAAAVLSNLTTQLYPTTTHNLILTNNLTENLTTAVTSSGDSTFTTDTLSKLLNLTTTLPTAVQNNLTTLASTTLSNAIANSTSAGTLATFSTGIDAVMNLSNPSSLIGDGIRDCLHSDEIDISPEDWKGKSLVSFFTLL